MKSKKVLKVVVAATLATAFVAPVVAPSFVPVAEASASALNNQLSELITISKDVQATPEYKRVFYNNRDWLETATSNAKSNLDYGNVNEKQTSIDALKAELNRPEIYKIVTQVYRSLPAGFSNYYERESTRTIKELITYTNYVIGTPEYERMYYNSRDWLETALSDARSQALYGDEIDQKNAINKLRAELNRYPMNTVLDAVKVNQPANFYNYSEPDYHTEIKFLITVSNAILKTPEYERLFYNSRDWFETALSNARSQALYGDELDQKAASNALKAELNRHGIRPIAEKVQTNVPGYFIEYTEESYDNEIKKLIIISNYVLNEDDYKALAYETRDSFETVLSDARSQALYGDRIDKTEAIEKLRNALNGSGINPIYNRVKDYYKDYSLNSSTREEPKKEEPKKEEVKTNESATLNKTVASLKQAIVANQGQVKSAEFLLNELPKTVKGKEQKLIKMMRSAYDLQVESANLVKELTGEVIVVAPLRIPANLR